MTLKNQLRDLNEAQLEDPLKLGGLEVGRDVVLGIEPPISEPIELMDRIERYPNHLSALCISHFAAYDEEGKPEARFHSIAMKWGVI